MANDKKTILIVDDSPSTRILIKNSFKNSGHDILETATADEAIERLEKTTPDLIITDNNTNSQKDGSDVIRAAREKGIRVIMASATPELHDSALELGATAFFSKTEKGYVGKLKEEVDKIIPTASLQTAPSR